MALGRENPRAISPAHRHITRVTVSYLTCACKSRCTSMHSRYGHRVPMQERRRCNCILGSGGLNWSGVTKAVFACSAHPATSSAADRLRSAMVDAARWQLLERTQHPAARAFAGSAPSHGLSDRAVVREAAPADSPRSWPGEPAPALCGSEAAATTRATLLRTR